MDADAKELAIGALQWSFFTMLPFFIVIGHRRGWMGEKYAGNPVLMQLSLFISAHIWVFAIGGIVMYGATAGAITTYWEVADPEFSTVSLELYLWTIGGYIAYIILLAASALDVFHGNSVGACKFMAVLAGLIAIFLLVSTAFSLSDIEGEKPASLIYVVVVFAIHVAWHAYYCYFVWKHCDDEYTGLSMQAGAESRTLLP